MPGLPEPISHYTDAVRARDTVYVSGLVATDEHGEVVGVGDVVAQARRVFHNLGLVLEAVGGRPADVAKVTVFSRPARWSRSAAWYATTCCSRSRRWSSCRRDLARSRYPALTIDAGRCRSS